MTTVLLIDDDKIILDLMEELLLLNGIKVIGRGYNGKDAVKLYGELTPDAVLLDISMPGYDGLYALKNIRMQNNNSIIIMITGDQGESTRKKLSELNPTATFFKPVNISKIISLLNEIDK